MKLDCIGVELFLRFALLADFILRTGGNAAFGQFKGPVEFVDDCLFVRLMTVQLQAELRQSCLSQLVIDDIQRRLFLGYEQNLFPVVEALRNSQYARRFDFEKYDAEMQNGHRKTDLFFKIIDKETGSIYRYATYENTSLHLRRFELSYRKNRALPRIESRRYYCRYQTIEQLMAMLKIVVPKIDELEKGILEDEQKDLRLKRIQEVYSATVPDLVTSSFEGSGLAYWYEMRRDGIFLKTRLPMRLSASFLIKFKNLSTELQEAIAISKEICEAVEKHGRIEIEKYSVNSIQWTETWFTLVNDDE